MNYGGKNRIKFKIDKGNNDVLIVAFVIVFCWKDKLHKNLQTDCHPHYVMYAKANAINFPETQFINFILAHFHAYLSVQNGMAICL